MTVSPPPAPSSIDLSGLPPRVVEAAARVLALQSHHYLANRPMWRNQECIVIPD